MHSITKEIKEVFDQFKKTSPPRRPVYASAPFSIIDQMWMYYFLFPEVLQVYDDYTLEEYEKYPSIYFIEEYRKFIFSTARGEALLYPCKVLSKEEILRIMKECGII